MDRKIIGIDMDDTLYDFVKPLLLLHNARFRVNIKESEITDYEIQKFLSPFCKNLFNEFANEDFFEKIKIKKNNIESINNLQKTNKIYFVTAGAPKTAQYRHKLLQRTFSWYKHNNLIIIGNKKLLDIDYLIDDCPHYVAACTRYLSILMSRPWNKNCLGEGFVRINSFKEFEKLQFTIRRKHG